MKENIYEIKHLLKSNRIRQPDDIERVRNAMIQAKKAGLGRETMEMLGKIDNRCEWLDVHIAIAESCILGVCDFRTDDTKLPFEESWWNKEYHQDSYIDSFGSSEILQILEIFIETMTYDYYIDYSGIFEVVYDICGLCEMHDGDHRDHLKDDMRSQLEMLKEEDKDVHTVAKRGLERKDFESLVEALKDDRYMKNERSFPPTNREAATKALGLLGDVRAITPLIGVMNNTDNKNRKYINRPMHWLDKHVKQDQKYAEAAARALSKIGDVQAIGPIIEAYRRWGDISSFHFGRSIMQSLSQFGDLGKEACDKIVSIEKKLEQQHKELMDNL